MIRNVTTIMYYVCNNPQLHWGRWLQIMKLFGCYKCHNAHTSSHTCPPKMQICRDWALRMGAIVWGVQGGPEGGCYLTQQTLPMCLTTAQREPAAAVFLYFLCASRSPHSDVNLISWEGFENLLQKQNSFLCWGKVLGMWIIRLRCITRAVVIVRWWQQKD